MVKYLITGSSGLLGRNICCELEARSLSFRPVSHSDLDITDSKQVLDAIERIQPETIINCAALCNFSKCEDFPEASKQINCDAPLDLAETCRQKGIKLCHFSSDYVFDGKSDSPYTEEDRPVPLSVYAEHKTKVEKALAAYTEHLLLRVALLFGKDGKTFMSMLPHLLMTRDSLEVASGKTGSCLYVAYGAKIILDMLESGADGLYNLVHRNPVTWENFARNALQYLQDLGLHPKCTKISEVPFSELLRSPGSGRRPTYSILDTGKIESCLGFPLQTWEEGLQNYISSLYPSRQN